MPVKPGSFRPGCFAAATLIAACLLTAPVQAIPNVDTDAARTVHARSCADLADRAWAADAVSGSAARGAIRPLIRACDTITYAGWLTDPGFDGSLQEALGAIYVLRLTRALDGLADLAHIDEGYPGYTDSTLVLALSHERAYAFAAQVTRLETAAPIDLDDALTR